MKFEDFLRIIASKVGSEAAFDLSRDSRFKALENILIEKEVATKDELEAALEKELGETASNIDRMIESSSKQNDRKK